MNGLECHLCGCNIHVFAPDGDGGWESVSAAYRHAGLDIPELDEPTCTPCVIALLSDGSGFERAP